MAAADAQRGDAAIAQRLGDLEIDYWYEVDHNWGRAAHEMYMDEGVFVIGEKRMAGRAEIREFYRGREARGERIARHVVTNLRPRVHDERCARLDCILLLYAADGEPILESRPAIMIADVISECVLDDGNAWRFLSRTLKPLFAGAEPATIPPDK